MLPYSRATPTKLVRMYSYPGTALKRPYPSHTLTPAAEAGRQTLRDYGLKRRHDRDAGNVQLVTRHVKPWAQIDVSDLVGAPALFAKAALAAGREVAAKRAGDAVCVAVRSPHIRAYWPRAEALVDGHACDLTFAKLRLIMSVEDATVERERIRVEAAEKRAATKAAKPVLS